MDLYNTVKSSAGLISKAYCRGLYVSFKDTNIFTESSIFHTGSGSANLTVDFENTNVYAEGGIPFHACTSDTSSNAPSGNVSINLKNSKIYGMTLGVTEHIVEAYSKAMYLNIYVMDDTTRISDTNADRVFLKGVTGAIVAKPETVTIDGVTYSTLYGLGTGEEETAKFDLYNVTFDQYNAEMTPVVSLDVVAGYWFATVLKPEGESF